MTHAIGINARTVQWAATGGGWAIYSNP